MKDLDFILHTGLQCTAAQRPRGHERREPIVETFDN